jgi:hypothetical protein
MAFDLEFMETPEETGPPRWTLYGTNNTPTTTHDLTILLPVALRSFWCPVEIEVSAGRNFWTTVPQAAPPSLEGAWLSWLDTDEMPQTQGVEPPGDPEE